MPEHVAAALLRQMLSAVQHLYLRGIVHRDLKPENFLFARREPENEPGPPMTAPIKLIDFGLSRRLSFEAGARITPKIGTTEYMAPEAFAGRVKPVLADRTDVWSLGVVLHVIFIGHFPSPRLAELTTEEYLALPCWKRISAQGRDILGQMLRYDPHQRPTVTMALSHPWLAKSAAGSPEADRLARTLPNAFGAFARAPELRRLALTAAAREVDESGVFPLREVFHQIELACEGALTRPALEKAAVSLKGHVALVASELARCFDAMDADGSGNIDWTEVLAAVLGANLSNRASRSQPVISSDETCWRSFDLLSQGTGSVTGSSLGQLLLSTDSHHNESSGGTGGSLDAGGLSGSNRPLNSVDLHRIVREVDSGGAVGRSRFVSLIQGN